MGDVLLSVISSDLRGLPPPSVHSSRQSDSPRGRQCSPSFPKRVQGSNFALRLSWTMPSPPQHSTLPYPGQHRRLPWTAPYPIPTSPQGLPLPVGRGVHVRHWANVPHGAACVSSSLGTSEKGHHSPPALPKSVALPGVPRRGPGSPRCVAPSVLSPGRQGRVWLPWSGT